MSDVAIWRLYELWRYNARLLRQPLKGAFSRNNVWGLV